MCARSGGRRAGIPALSGWEGTALRHRVAAPGGAPAGQVVVLGEDSQVADLVAQGVPVDAEGAGGAAEISLVRLERGDDELALELSPRLLQGEATADQLVYDLVQSSVEILLGQIRLLGTAEGFFKRIPQPSG